MELTGEQIQSLLRENENKTTEKNEVAVNCIRKKFKCIMLWLLSIISVTQLLLILFEKLDEKYFNKLVEKLYGLIKSDHNKTGMR